MTASFGPLGTCRTCGAAVVWCLTSRGKRMPVDPDPDPTGTLAITGFDPDSGAPTIRVVAVNAEPTLTARYRLHFATCPDAAQHRR